MVQKTVKLKDVAQAAHVSTATVSRALSNPDALSAETRKAVFEAIQTTGYRVNQAARNLRMQRAGAILTLVPNLGNPFFSEILAGISSVFMDSDISVLIADTQAKTGGDRQLADAFLTRIDGVISLDGNVSPEALRSFRNNVPDERVVFACEWRQDSALPSIRSDNEQGARLAVRHLFNLGHRDIAHVTGPEDNVLTHERRRGMLDERARLGLPAREGWIIRGDFSLEAGRAAAHKLLAMEHRPTAVFCASDQVAFGLIAALTAAGLNVPRDLSVVGFDDVDLSEFYVPALTTIRQNRRALGASAAKLLLDKLKGEPAQDAGSNVITIDVELVCRDSTAPPSTRSKP